MSGHEEDPFSSARRLEGAGALSDTTASKGQLRSSIDSKDALDETPFAHEDGLHIPALRQTGHKAAAGLTDDKRREVLAGDNTLATLAPVKPQLKDFFLPNSKRAVRDLDSVATQPSVFDDPVLAPYYWPPQTWENYENWDVNIRWTWREEKEIVRIVDRKVLVWVCLLFAMLNLDRSNTSAANTDKFLPELGMTNNDFNNGQTVRVHIIRV